eukprot:NODE_120_length_17920_cov_0.559782.p3 type:complete len:342 gc:universal NODE_120_length_17920_cov_0.559782:8701-9726(+)
MTSSTSYTISEDFLYQTFEPLNGDFTTWAKGLKKLLNQEEDLAEKVKVKALLYYLPPFVRREVISEITSLDFEVMISKLEERYKPTEGSADFYHEEQKKEEKGVEFVKRMEELGNRLKVPKSDIMRQIKLSLTKNLSDRVVSNYYPDLQQLKQAINDTEKLLDTELDEKKKRKVEKCNKCNRMGHSTEECNGPSKCYSCGQYGHKQWNCPKENEKGESNDKKPDKVIKRVGCEQIKVDKYQMLEIEGVLTRCLIDTGADISCLGRNVVSDRNIPIVIESGYVNGIDGKVKILGSCKLAVKFGDEVIKQQFTVLDCNQDIIIGRDLIARQIKWLFDVEKEQN